MYLHSYTIIKSNFLLLQLGGLISFKHVICNKQIITCQEPDRFYLLVFNTISLTRSKTRSFATWYYLLSLLHMNK